MTNTNRLYWPEAILLLTVTIPLAIAEGAWAWLYVGLSAAAGLIGWWTTVRHDRPLIGPLTSRIFVIAAFGLLVLEYLWTAMIPVMALSHFMILVCICKLLQRRTLRDHAQIFVLSLLLLVVAAIVSGNLLFPVALAIYMGVGLEALIRFHFHLETQRVAERNRQIHPNPATIETALGTKRHPLCRVVFTASLCGISAGILIFVLFPRVGAGMFGRLEGPGTGRAITGFASTLNFNTIGTVQESDRPVMRVIIEGAESLAPGEPLYFRGTVLDRYSCEQPPLGPWEWRRIGSRAWNGRKYSIRRPEEDWTVPVLPTYHSDGEPLIVQHYYLEPTDVRFLFTAYPAVDMRLDVRLPELEDIRKWIEDQVLEVPRMPTRPVRYTIWSPPRLTSAAREALAEEYAREGALKPEVLPPRPALPREREVLALIAEAAGEPGDTPEQRLAFVRRLEEFLQSSGRFKYTLSPPSFPSHTEPVGDFLLRRKEGHCEYFASAMAIMCQLSGIPARVVSGYCGGDYNPVGNFYVVRQKHAHSWVEVYIPGMDWIRSDPTPSAEAEFKDEGESLAAITRYFDYLQFQWASLVVTYDADARRNLFRNFESWLMRPAQNENTLIGAVTAFTRELFGWRLQLHWRERLIYWVFTLLVVTLAVLVGYVVVVLSTWGIAGIRRRLRESRRARVAETEFYERYCQRLRSLGLVRRADLTPAEFADELARKYAVFAEAPELIEAYYLVLFGRRSLSGEIRSFIEGFLGRLQQVDRSQLRPSTPGPS